MDWAGVGGKAQAIVDFARFDPSEGLGLISTPVRESSSLAAPAWCWPLFFSLAYRALLSGFWSRISGLPLVTGSVPGAITEAVERRRSVGMRLVRLAFGRLLAVALTVAWTAPAQAVSLSVRTDRLLDRR